MKIEKCYLQFTVHAYLVLFSSEQNLKRLRDINEEIQRLRVTSQRNHREV